MIAPAEEGGVEQRGAGRIQLDDEAIAPGVTAVVAGVVAGTEGWPGSPLRW